MDAVKMEIIAPFTIGIVGAILLTVGNKRFYRWRMKRQFLKQVKNNRQFPQVFEIKKPIDLEFFEQFKKDIENKRGKQRNER